MVEGSRFDWQNRSSEEISNLLRSAKTIAIVGLSAEPGRPSHGVARYLQEVGFKIIPVNPNESEILGEKAYPDLQSIPEDIDIVDVFRKPSEALPLVEDAHQKGVKAVWLQEGVVSPEAFKKGEKYGLIMVMDKCMFKEHMKLGVKIEK
jgi:predicted CoA-binding protein